MSSRVDKVITGRKGLWLLIFGPLLVLIATDIQEDARADFRRGGTTFIDGESLDGNEPWQELPGFAESRDDAFPPQPDVLPEPTSNEPLAVTAVDDGFIYRIDYENGASYEAQYQEYARYNRVSFVYEVPDKPFQKWFGRLLIPAGGMALVLGVISLLANLSGSDRRGTQLATAATTATTEPIAQATIQATASTTAAPLAAALLVRWLQRSRYYRLVGALVAASYYLVFVVANRHLVLNTLVLCMVAGMALGGAFAELHVIRRKPERTAIAGLSSRRFSDYTERADRGVLAIIAVAAVSIAGLSRTTVLAASALGPSLAALLVVAIVVWFQRLVVSRPRSALSADMRQADDLLRHLAVTQGFARPGIALACFLICVALVDPSHPAWLELVAQIPLVAGFGWLFIGRQARIPKMAERALST